MIDKKVNDYELFLQLSVEHREYVKAIQQALLYSQNMYDEKYRKLKNNVEKGEIKRYTGNIKKGD